MDDREPRPTEEAFQPIRVLQAELSERLPSIAALDTATGRKYSRAQVLVRLHSRPLGVVQLRLGNQGLSPDEVASQIQMSLRGDISRHLLGDDLPDDSVLTGEGLRSSQNPTCLRHRIDVLANAPFVSVVVPTHDRPDLIHGCLDSLSRLDYPRYEIIVVDNAPSTAEISDTVRRHCGDTARYVREDRPGASWARNRGLLEARGEIVAFTDDDAIADGYWLVELVKSFRSGENVGCVTGNVLPRELDTAAQAWFEGRGGFSRGFEPRIFDTGEHRLCHPLYPYSAMLFGSGNNMAFRSSLLKSIGGFDPALDPASPSRGGEDLAAFFEVVLRGFQLVYEPGAIVHHLHRRDYDGLRRQMYGWGTGFSAYLIRTLVAHPRLVPDFMSKLPHVLSVVAKGAVPYKKNHMRNLAEFFPASRNEGLWRAEAGGYLYGLLAYGRSLMRVRRLESEFGALSVDRSADV